MPKSQSSSEPLTKTEFKNFIQSEFIPLKEDFQEFKEKQDQMSNTLDKVYGLIQEARDEQDLNRERIESLEEIHPKHQHAPV